MDYQKFQESMGQFEQFTQQFTTYTSPENIVPHHNNSIKIHNYHDEYDKPKLKIINQLPDKIYPHQSSNQRKKNKKIFNYNSEIITLGHVVFKGNFQSGNIDKVQKLNTNTYQITLRKQLNSNRVSTWFYFSVSGLKGEIKIIIKGFNKTCSLFNQGMKICYKELQQGKWRRGGTKIIYQRSPTDKQQIKQTYQLQFYFFFKSNYPNTVQFAYCFPYTYTHLIQFLSTQENNMQIQSLGKSYQNRDIPLITIGNPCSKYVILISARTHPGQTVGSWMMEGFLQQLLTDSQYSKYLRSTFLFKIIPMLNPDGVVCGNYRFSASGYDLNRKWKTCNQRMHPQIYCFKQLIKQITKQKQIVMFIDFHGHSRQKNVFFYGCSRLNQNGQSNTRPKQFPFLMSKIHPPFCYQYCNYSIKKQKQGTARIYLWNQLKIDFVYTLEASFCGTDGISNFIIADYIKIGKKLIQGISQHFLNIISQLTNKPPISPPQKKIHQQLKNNMIQFLQNPQIQKIQHDGNSSDSQPEAGQISQLQRKKQKRAISIQKYYRATKIMKFNQKNYQEDTHNKNNIIYQQYNIKNNKIKNNIMFQVKHPIINNKMLLTTNMKNLNKSISPKSQSQFYIGQEYMNKTFNKNIKLDIIHKQQYDKFQSETTLSKNHTHQINISNRSDQYRTKKTVIGFQGAQYRRVRKLAQQNIRKHFSNQNSTLQKHPNPFTHPFTQIPTHLQIQKIGIKQLKGTYNTFPTTSHQQNTKKNKCTSVDSQLRKNIKIPDFTSRKLSVNGREPQVKCYGRQIM